MDTAISGPETSGREKECPDIYSPGNLKVPDAVPKVSHLGHRVCPVVLLTELHQYGGFQIRKRAPSPRLELLEG